MIRARFVLAALLVGLGNLRAATTGLLRGRLEQGSAGEVVLTLDVDAGRLASLADKENREKDQDVAALADLIRERFHYLLRLRVAGGDFAPTSVDLSLPPPNAPLPDVLQLTATWANVPPGGMQVVTQTDRPQYRVELAVVDRRGAKPRPTAIDAGAARAARQRLRSMGEGAKIALGRLMPDGVEQLLFVLGVYFSARTARELGLRLMVFVTMHSVALGLEAGAIVPVGGLAAHWLGFAISLSLVALAVVNCLTFPLDGQVSLLLFGGAGLLHGWGMAGAWSGVHWPEGGRWPAVTAATLAVALALLLVVGLATLFGRMPWRGSWERPEIAVPASVVIGLGGLGWTLERLQDVGSLLP